MMMMPPPASAASEAADESFFEETVVITSTTSGLADARVPPTGRAEVPPADLAGLLHARAEVLLDMAEADSVYAASRRAPPPPGEVESGRSLPPAAAGIR